MNFGGWKFPIIGTPAPMQEIDTATVLDGLASFTAVVNDPPWQSIAGKLPKPNRLVINTNMDEQHLKSLAAQEPDTSEVVVGIGGGTAMDTAKFIAWTSGKRLIQIPSILSVDAAFTREVGVRINGSVRYVGDAQPELVVIDIPLIQSAPKRLNRAGVGDILSCHTAMWDWQRTVADEIVAHPWRDDLADLATTLLRELDAATADLNAVSTVGVRFLAAATQAIGAACAEAGHARFEEGSEHFFAYSYERATRAHHVHGELVALGSITFATIQNNNAEWVDSIVRRTGLRANPEDLGVMKTQFHEALVNLRDYTRAENLWHSAADVIDISESNINEAWSAATALPHPTD